MAIKKGDFFCVLQHINVKEVSFKGLLT